MRLAYFILLHHHARQFQWLFEAISNLHDIFLIHIDKKASPALVREVEQITTGNPNVHFLPRRTLSWGGWSLAEVELRAIRWLLDRVEPWDYFINLSGQDYPLKPRSEIIEALSVDPSLNYVRLLPMDERRIEAHRRCRYFCFEFGGRVIRTWVPLRRPREIQIEWKGSGWHILTRSFCEWVARDSLVERAARYFRHVYIPDELFMQFLLMNSPFAHTAAPEYRRLILWQGTSPHPVTLTMKHVPVVESSDAFFARKFDETVDRQVLELLRRRLDPAAS